MHNYLAIDFETANNSANSACAIGLVRIEDGKIADTFYSLIKPPNPFFLYTHIHGICKEDIVDAPSFSDIFPKIIELSANTNAFIAHNAAFDQRVLYACCESYNLTKPRQNFHCTLQLSRKRLNLQGYKLNEVCEYYNIELNHHHAMSDAMACAKLYINLCDI